MKNQSLLSFASLILLLGAGCDREEPTRTYTEPKSREVAMPMPPAQPAASPAAAQRPRLFDWKLPAGWSEDPQPRAMRETTAYTSADAASRAEVVVSRLGAQFGDMLGNINRWRGQVGLPPLEKEESGEALELPAGKATLFSLEGPEQSQLVVRISRSDSNWFFKLIGPKAAVAKDKQAFLDVLKTISFSE